MKKRQNIRSGILLLTFFLFPALYYYLSPYLIFDAVSHEIINGSYILFLTLFLGALIFGRAYCGWICPAAGCQESISRIRDRKTVKGNLIKWFLWIPWFSAIIILTIQNHPYRKVDFLYQTTYGLSISDVYGLITYLFVLLLIILPAFLIGKRSFCHHICWMAPFMIIGRKVRNIFRWPALHLSAETKLCIHCHTCTMNCPMSLPVEDMVNSNRMENSECILCGTCIDGCQNQAIQYMFKVNSPIQ